MHKKLLLFLFLLFLFVSDITAQSLQISPIHLTCEYMTNPLGIDKRQPLLGWQIQSTGTGVQQTAYQIIVASSESRLHDNDGDIWDSGKINSSQSQNIYYKGQPLLSKQFYYWKVKIWTGNSQSGVWSQPAFWSVGMLNKNDWKAKWISDKFSEVSDKREPKTEYDWPWPTNKNYVSEDTAAVYLRKTFSTTSAIKTATVYISGLGYYELNINGIKVGDRVMDPVFSDYQRSVYYATYDVTGLLKKNENVAGVILGNGFYNSPTVDLFQMEQANWKTPPKLLFELHIEYKNGKKEVIISDNTWKWSTGEIVYNSIRSGETIDHRKQQKNWNSLPFDDSRWQNAIVVPQPIGTMRAQLIPPMRINETVAPQKISEPLKNIYVVDFGKNMTGWISLRIKGNPGQKIECWYNEELNKDGTLNKTYSSSHTGGRFQKEEFILSSKDEEYFEPRFTYHGFRYIQLEGLSEKPAITAIKAKGVHTSLDTIGNFSCSNEQINHLQKAVQRTLLNCIHGMPGEEPTREKMGWTQDALNAMEPYLYNFDAVNAYKKCLQDFIDAQEPGGHIPAIVPTNGWSFLTPEGKTVYFDDPWWGGTIFYIVDKLYDYTGDTGVIIHAFDAMKRYVDFVATTAKDDLVYWSLGDWLDMTHTNKGPGLTPVVQTSTAAYYWMNERLSAFAKMLNKYAISAEYAKNADRIKNVFNTAFLDTSTGWYKEGSQTAQVLPLYLGMVPQHMVKKVEAKLIEAIENNNNHVSTGFIGVAPFLSYLSQNGFMKKCYEVFSQLDSPGWLQMVANGQSTLGENLNSKGYGTGHHPFGAHIGFWLYKYLGGIRVDPGHPGFQFFIIAPQFMNDLNYMHVETHSLYGKIVSAWKREGTKIDFTITVPGNTSAKLVLPVSDNRNITMNGQNINDIPAIKLIEKKKDQVIYKLGSGNYGFIIH